jgi:hypothetical protein
MNPAVSSSPTDWIAIEYTTGFLLVFLALYFPVAKFARRLGRKKWTAAPRVPSHDVGGKAWWPVSVTPLLVFVMAAYLGLILFFLGYPGTKAASIVVGLLALGVAMWTWIWPFFAKLRNWSKKRRHDKDDGEGPRFPGEEEADFQVVSPYESPDSSSRSWWRRRGPKDGASA